MSQPIRVLHVLGNSKLGGATYVVLSPAEMAREHGLSVEILTGDPMTVDACAERGIDVVRFDKIIRPIRPHKDLWAAWKLSRLVRRYEILHTHTSKGGAVGRLAGHLAKTPIVLYCPHGFYFHQFSSGMQVKAVAWAEKRMARWCDRIIMLNQYDLEIARRMGIGRDEQYVTIYNGVPDSRLAPAGTSTGGELLAELGLGEDCFLCVHVGRLAYQKGLCYLLEAMALIGRRGSPRPIHLALVGDGELGEELQAQALRLGIADRVHMLGFRSDCLRWTGGGDLFVMSSLFEGHSITLLEAMGLAKPIVATAVKGNTDTLTDGADAIMVPAMDPPALADAIVAMAGDPSRAASLARAGERTFRERFTEQKMKDTTWQMYRGLLVAKGLMQP